MASAFTRIEPPVAPTAGTRAWLTEYGGATVSLSSANTVGSGPASVVIPAGQTSATFQVTTQPVPSEIVFDIEATANGTTAFAPLTVNPAPAGSGPPAPLAPANGASVTVPFALSWSAVSDQAGIAYYNWQVSPSSSMTPVVAQATDVARRPPPP